MGVAPSVWGYIERFRAYCQFVLKQVTYGQRFLRSGIVPGALLIPVIVGGAIFLLGLIFAIWGHREETNYYDSMASRADLREFFSRWPPRVEPGALKVGGWIGIIVGIVTVGLGLLFYFVGG